MAKKDKPLTFADRAKSIMKRYGFNETTGKFLREDDAILKSSMDSELEQLKQEQELAKHEAEVRAVKAGKQLPMGQQQMPMEGQQPMMAYGGIIPEFEGLSEMSFVPKGPAYIPDNFGQTFGNMMGYSPAPSLGSNLLTPQYGGAEQAAQAGEGSGFLGGLKQGIQDNPYLAVSAGTQLLGTAGKAAYLAGRDTYTPFEYEPTPIADFNAVDFSEAEKAARAQIAGTKGAIKKGARTRGELLGNLSAASANEGAAVAQISQQEENVNAQARNQYNMQVAQIKLQDAARKLQTGMINKDMYDTITANWLGVLDEGIMGLAGTSKDYNAAQVQRDMMRFTGTSNYGQIRIGNQTYPVFIDNDGNTYYQDDNGQRIPLGKK